MAFQGKKRILYYIIQITSVLPLMGYCFNERSVLLHLDEIELLLKENGIHFLMKQKLMILYQTTLSKLKGTNLGDLTEIAMTEGLQFLLRYSKIWY